MSHRDGIYKTPEILDGDILRMRISLTAKRVLSLLRHCQDGQHKAGLSQSWIAQRLSMSRQAVGRALQQLIDHTLIQTDFKQHQQITIYRLLGVQQPKKFFLFFLNSVDSGQNASLLYVYLRYRQGDNQKSWPHIKTICADLGMSKSTAIRAINTLEKGGYISVDHAHGGLKQGNRYQLTDKPFVCHFETPNDQSGVSKCNAINNTHKEFKRNSTEITPAARVYQENSRNLAQSCENKGDIWGTSGGHTKNSSDEYAEKLSLLVKNRVHKRVAASLAADHSLDEIKAAVLNAAAQCQVRRTDDPRLARTIKIAGYIVASLNAAKREGQKVKKNSFIRWHEAQRRRAAEKAQQPKSELMDDLKAQRLKSTAAEMIRQLRAVVALENAQIKLGVA